MSEIFLLVVEDEPSIAEVVSLYPKRAGYQVKVVSDGQAALLPVGWLLSCYYRLLGPLPSL